MSKGDAPDAEGHRPKVRLFCFPYAGGDSVSIYRSWKDFLGPEIQLVPISLPGRGVRIQEPPVRNLPRLAEVLEPLVTRTDEVPFAFFGHSMGGLLAFELAHLLRSNSGCLPTHLFVSAVQAPQLCRMRRAIYHLPDAEFINELKDLNGTPIEFFNNPELLSLLLPMLRADFEAFQSYRYLHRPPLALPISLFGGIDDRITRSELEAWQEQSLHPLSLQMCAGDHFFVRLEGERIARYLRNTLLPFRTYG